MNENDAIPVTDIIQYAYTCQDYESAASIIHLLDKFCGTSQYAVPIENLKKYFKSLQYGTSYLRAEINNSYSDRLQKVITAVANEGVMREKRDFAVIHRLILDYGIRDTLTYADFVRYLHSRCFIPPYLLPSASTLSKVLIRGTYPNWRFIDINPEVEKRFMKVASLFVKYWDYSVEFD